MDIMTKQREIELLAPARDAIIAVEAIKHGADAVYIGASSHGARVAAGNSIADIAAVVEYAHKFNARVYVTVNTIIYDNELREVVRLIHNLYRIGVDALIVQDMAVLRLDIPPIALHASTQCDTRDKNKARFLEQVGFSQIVLARELSLDEIAGIKSSVNVPLEAFVHGALCVSYSGDCQASCVAMGRSANRGECTQMCRLPYDLLDTSGNKLISNKYLLSLRDLNRSTDVAAMIEAGVSSFKIEGRLKDVSYVKNTVAAYRRAIDEVIALYPDRYCRKSCGESQVLFTPDLSKSFNRGFTRYFADKQSEKQPMASMNTPKSVGEKVGVVKFVANGYIVADLTTKLHNGDGLGYFNTKGEFCGFRLNRVEDCKLFPASVVDVPSKTILYRNKDKEWDDIIYRETATRIIKVDFKLRSMGNMLILDAEDERGNQVTTSIEIEPQEARTPQEDARKRVLEKVGGTIYKVNSIIDEVGAVFVPASQLTDLRRRTIEMLDRAQRMTYNYDCRFPENKTAKLPMGETLSYHDNVANVIAHKFYFEHGAKTIQPAIELSQPEGEKVVMTTRYCLRRELGYCMKTLQGKKIPAPLFIETGNMRFRLDFNCSECRMKVVKLV